MRISPKSDYAIRAVLDLSRHYHNHIPVSATTIAERQNIPLKYLEQILLVLKKAGIVNSKRGIGGGFLLNKSPEKIFLGEIIRSIEGDINPAAGITIDQQNNDHKALEEVWVKVTELTSTIVDSVSFADIMLRAEELTTRHDVIDFVI